MMALKYARVIAVGVLIGLITNAVGAFFWSVLVLNNQIGLAYMALLPQALVISVVINLIARKWGLGFLATTASSQVGWVGGVLGSAILLVMLDPHFQRHPSGTASQAINSVLGILVGLMMAGVIHLLGWRKQRKMQ